jgi:hypothetical protein
MPGKKYTREEYLNELKHAQKSFENSQTLRIGARMGLLRETGSQQGFGKLRKEELQEASKGASHIIRAAMALDTSRIMNGQVMLNNIAKQYVDEYPEMLLLTIGSYEKYCKSHGLEPAKATRYMSIMAREHLLPKAGAETIDKEAFKAMRTELNHIIRNSVRRIVRK